MTLVCGLSFARGKGLPRSLLTLLLSCALLAVFVPDSKVCNGALSYKVEVLGKDGSRTVAPVVKATYSNGLVALIKESHSSQIVTVDVWCSTGSACEKKEQGGISHFFEHMFFKGTERHPRGEMDRIIKGLGGRNNAGTSVEYTHYYVTVPSENYLVALDVLSDALLNSVFERQEVERERKVVRAEKRRKQDRPTSEVFVFFQKQFAAGTPYQRPVLGTFETLEGIDREAFLDYLNEKYKAGNMAVVVTGDVDTDEVLGAIGQYFEALKPGRSPYPEFEVPRLKANAVGIERKDVNQGYMILGFLTDGLKNSDENLSLDVAAAVLGEGKSSRLYQKLVEERKLASRVEAWSWPLRQAGILGFQITFEPGKEESVKVAVLEELETLGAVGPSAAEVEKAKALLRTKFAFSTETTAGKAVAIGRAYTMGMLDEFLDYHTRLDSVNLDKVREVVSKYTTGKHYALAMILPEETSEEAHPLEE